MFPSFCCYDWPRKNITLLFLFLEFIPSPHRDLRSFSFFKLRFGQKLLFVEQTVDLAIVTQCCIAWTIKDKAVGGVMMVSDVRRYQCIFPLHLSAKKQTLKVSDSFQWLFEATVFITNYNMKELNVCPKIRCNQV